jgi:hypothetical protein
MKIITSNQEKRGDPRIKTASSSEVEALRRFADDWAHRIRTSSSKFHRTASSHARDVSSLSPQSHY